MIRFAALAFLLFLGCSKAPVTAPETRSATIVSAQAVKAWVTLESGQKVLAWVELDRAHPGLATVLYICDYPMGMYGPLPTGHCYTDGSYCIGLPGSWNPEAYVTHSFVLDPDDTGNILDPDTGDNIQGDGDGTPIHAKAAGDPTADD